MINQVAGIKKSEKTVKTNRQGFGKSNKIDIRKLDVKKL